MKNKYLRKLLTGALIVASLSMTACGNGMSLDSDDKDEEQTESDEDEDEKEEEDKEDSEKEDDKDSEDEESEDEEPEEEESEDNAEQLYEEVLSGDREILFSDGGEAVIGNFWEWDTIRYVYADVDGDGEDELCLKDRAALYVLEVSDDTVYTSFEGCTYHMPIDDGDLHGIYYYRPGAAPFHENFQFTEFDADGVLDKTTCASWYDANENGEMDEDDWFFLDGEEEEEVDMDDWLEVGQQFLDLKDTDVDYEEIEFEDAEDEDEDDEDNADIEVITDEEEAVEAAEILFMAYEGEYEDTEVDLHMIEVFADNEYDEYYIVGNGFNPVYADECIEVRYGDEYDEYIFLDDDYMTTYYKIVDDGTQVVVLYASTYEEIDKATIEDGECCGSFDL